METSELLKKVRKIEIKTRGLSNHLFAGQYHSAFKGKGMTFSEVREYQYGDDVRTIDWNVTARFNHPFVKVFEEDRELTVMLLIDISGSGNYGTRKQWKRELITEISAVLSFSAIQNNDKIGAMLFSNKVEKFIPPKKGRQHILRIIRELLEFEPENKTTDIAEALKYFTNSIKKRCTAFLLSDFMHEGFEDALRIAGRKHDLIALRIYDHTEQHFPLDGLVHLCDAETGDSQWVDFSNPAVRNHFNQWFSNKEKRLADAFTRSGVDTVSIATGEDYVKPLLNLFKHR